MRKRKRRFVWKGDIINPIINMMISGFLFNICVWNPPWLLGNKSQLALVCDLIISVKGVLIFSIKIRVSYRSYNWVHTLYLFFAIAILLIHQYNLLFELHTNSTNLDSVNINVLYSLYSIIRNIKFDKFINYLIIGIN